MNDIYDIAIVGGGPAGLTAALYALRNGKKVIVIEKAVFGGQIVNSPRVENIPGIAVISGEEYGDLLMDQVSKLGAELLFDEVLTVDVQKDLAIIKLDLGEDIIARSVIIANGSRHRTLGLANEEELIGKGIHFCAVCDGNFYKDKTVVVIGGGNSAFVETAYLANICKEVIMLQDLPFFTADKQLQASLIGKENITKYADCKILEYVLRDGKLCGVRYLNNSEEKIVACDGVFLAVGLVPDNSRFRTLAELDANGYFIADETGHTIMKNIFVAGDCRTKNLRQVATACADGANAANEACRYLG